MPQVPDVAPDVEHKKRLGCGSVVTVRVAAHKGPLASVPQGVIDQRTGAEKQRSAARQLAGVRPGPSVPALVSGQVALLLCCKCAPLDVARKHREEGQKGGVAAVLAPCWREDFR